jgi:hypothetical protein
LIRKIAQPRKTLEDFLRRRNKAVVNKTRKKREESIRAELNLSTAYADSSIFLDDDSHKTKLVGAALEDALEDRVVLPASVRDIEGMSGQKYRSFINSLVRRHPDPMYLEIGSWKGSTAVSALFDNRVKALCIDNWCQFGGPKDEFMTNIQIAKSQDISFDFIESDFREIGYHNIGKFNIYMFDGPHKQEDHHDGIVIAQEALEDEFILIIDDWNWYSVRIGTLEGIVETGCTVVSSVEIRTTSDDMLPVVRGRDSDWHNGYFIAVLRKATH